MMLVSDLFSYKFYWHLRSNKKKSDLKLRPKFEISLKSKKSPSILKMNGMPFSGANKEYFLHHIDDPNLAVEAYKFRCSLLNIRTCLAHFKSTQSISEDDYEKVIEYLEIAKVIEDKNRLASFQRPDVRTKVKASNIRTAPIRAKKLSKNWKDPEKRKRYIVSMNDQKMISKRVEKFKQYISENYDEYIASMNSSERLQKISASSKEMWKNRTSFDKKRLLPIPASRNHEVNGIKMNGLEARIANRLNARGIVWEYEKEFKTQDSMYYPDFFLTDYDVAIEAFGDFWHANPSMYEDGFVLFEDTTAKMVRDVDKQRLDELKKLGLFVSTVWESDAYTIEKIDAAINTAIQFSKFVIEELSLAELAQNEFKEIDFDVPGIYDFDNHIEVLSQKNGKRHFTPMTSFIVKEGVDSHYRLGELLASSAHRVLYDGNWVKMQIHPNASLIKEPLKIVDISVPETECYEANGQLNHNTTSGGMAIPFHASTRIQLIGGSKIEKDDELIGINVEAKIIKNKVAPPFRRMNFQIHFGVGLKDHEECFDILRDYCDENGPSEIDGKWVCISGKGAWKSLTLSNSKEDHDAARFFLEKKFYKEKFDELWEDEKYQENLEKLLAIVLVKTPKQAHRDAKKETLGQDESNSQETK